MNHRLTTAAGFAVLLAAVSEFALIHGAAWYVEAAGAIAVVALAGTLTRTSQLPAAVGATLLALAACVPLLTNHAVGEKLIGAAIVICCGASASGLRPLRLIAGLVTYLAALLLFLNLVLAFTHSFIGVIPTSASVQHLINLARAGASATGGTPPVNGGSHGVQLLAAGCIGGAAIVVDVVAVRLRRPAIAGLPLLVIYLAPIATTASVDGMGGVIAFLLAAAGYLALLSSDGRNRLRGWGRVVTVWHSAGEDDRLAGADMGGLTATGRRIGLAALCMAVVVPLILPHLQPHQLGVHSGSGGGGQGPTVGLPDPVVQLHGLLSRSTPEPVLSYHTRGGDAGDYLGVYVLNYNDALSQWDLIQPTRTNAVSSAPLQQAPGLTAATPETLVRTRITLGKVSGYSFQDFFLPVPYWPAEIAIKGSWREADGTLMIFSGQSDHADQSYTVTSGEVEPTPAELAEPQVIPRAIRAQYLGLHSPLSGQLLAIAKRVTRGKTTAYAKAVALERWFHSFKFSYNLRTTNLPNTPAGLLEFLTKEPTGYCQQFAFAMAVLARLLGIPSRVAIGYTAGSRQPDGTWLVTTADAHAWPELYFSGAGWVRFEPTPGGQNGQATAVQPPWATSTRTTGPGSQSTSSSSGGASAGQSVGPSGLLTNPHVRGPSQGAAKFTAPKPPGPGIAGPVLEALLALLLLAAVTPASVRIVARRRRWARARDDTSLARAAWQEFCADLEDYGMACGVSESPRAVARRVCAIAGLDDPARRAIRRIADIVERARYAPRPEPAGAIRADVARARRALARTTSLTTRWRARLWPASTLRPTRSAGRQILGLATGWAPAGEASAS